MSELSKDEHRCIYCGTAGSLTADHVPPRCLFAAPRPSDLITVPACQTCNASFGLDDEYFRIAVVMPAIERHPAAERLWREQVLGRTLARSPALRATLIRDITEVQYVTKAGLYLGTTQAVTTKRRRIHRVVHRIVRGLLWHHYKQTPAQHAVLRTPDDPDVRPILPILTNDTHLACLAEDVFRYRYGVASEDSRYSLWWLCFYRTATFLTIVEPAAEPGDQRG